jgi:DNA-binding NarL/FixJ family response regulator
VSSIIVADSHNLYRLGLVKTIATSEDHRIVAQCADWSRLTAAIERFPGAIIIASPDLAPSIDAIATAAERSHCKVMLILNDTESYPAAAFRGILGIFRRSIPIPEFVNILKQVEKGNRCIPAVAKLSNRDEVGARVAERLTEKEKRILALLTEGMKNKDIASRVHTTEQVIKNVFRMIFDKTGVSDRLELVLFVLHHETLERAVRSSLFRYMQAEEQAA